MQAGGRGFESHQLHPSTESSALVHPEAETINDRSTNSLTRRSLAIVVVVIGVLMGTTAIVVAAQNDALPFQTSSPTTTEVIEAATTTSVVVTTTEAASTTTTETPPPFLGIPQRPLATTPQGPTCGTDVSCATEADRGGQIPAYQCNEWTRSHESGCIDPAPFVVPTGPPDTPRMSTVRWGYQDQFAVWHFNQFETSRMDGSPVASILTTFKPSNDPSVRWYQLDCEVDGVGGPMSMFGAEQWGIDRGADHWMNQGTIRSTPSSPSALMCRVRAGSTFTDEGYDIAFWSEWSDWLTSS